MAAYINIHGQKIQYVSSDPASPQTGQVWYNSTSNTLKYRAVQASNAWSTGGALNTGRGDLSGAGASSDSGLAFGGEAPSSGGAQTVTEKYNGSTWTEVGDLNSNRILFAGNGIQTSAIAVGGISGGSKTGKVETFDGSSWTETTDLNTPRRDLASSGPDNTASVAMGGNGDPPRQVGNVELWNGSSWTETTDLNTIRRLPGAAGSSNTNALCFGGEAPAGGNAVTAVTEKWNGSSWTEVSDLNTARTQVGQAGPSNTSALCFGGADPSQTAITEEWNGSSWTETTDLNVPRSALAGNGTVTSALAYGGPSSSTATEEWAEAGSGITNTISTS